MAEPRVIAYTSVFGPLFEDYFQRICIPSALQPGNLPAINHHWLIVTTPEQEEPVRAMCEQHIGTAADWELLVRPLSTVSADGSKSGEFRHFPAFLEVQDRCIAEGAYFLLLPPNNFWGNGSIKNLVRYAENRQFVIAAPQLWVLDELLLANLAQRPLPLSNAQTVQLTFDSLHQCAWEMLDEEPLNATWNGGVSLRPIGPSLWTLTHSFASPWLAWFTASDQAYWQARWEFGSWDHDWPALVVQEDRLRVIGSSDISWNCSVTQVRNHHGNLEAGHQYNDRVEVGQRLPHCEVLGKFAMGVRAE